MYRKLCCPYTAGLSLQLMNTDVSQLMSWEEKRAEDTLIYEVFPFLPLHKTEFYKSDQQHLHGFLIMREVYDSAESERRDVVYWRTHGLNSVVQLSRDYREAVCCRYSPACKLALQLKICVLCCNVGDDVSVAEHRMRDLSIRPLRRTYSVTEITAERSDYRKSPLLRNSVRQVDSNLYSVFIRDTALIWSALYRYISVEQTSQPSFTAFLASNTLLPYCPQTGATPSELQVPLEMRRSLRARTHNEIKDGYPTSLFMNPDTMMLVSNSQVPLYQATYFLEFQETRKVAILFYVGKSAEERYLAMPSQNELSETQLKTKLSDNLASHIDRQQTEVAVGIVKNKVLSNLLPKLDKENCLFEMGGTHKQFYLYKKSPHRYHYWKVKPDNVTVLTVNSTEASLFQLMEKSS